ncbi:MAG: Coenzyme PQQ synthesis protein D [uncultured Thiotrichaceae bacterium]|uniref:PqqA binding protein n=1 Tax=uncultured Thiotrichaceae bacterium TaxID=298394 RepID=A0A6S6TYJ3_9GAMM|nr:MAG: Coenzyme PQQ synthesis protein D [uncultured Thiotrichaceae bacterium]
MNTESIPALSPLFRFQWEEAQQCHVVLYPEGMVKLSPSAGEIMKQVNGEANVATIIQTLSELFDGADVGDDVMAFIKEAEGNGWIQLK